MPQNFLLWLLAAFLFGLLVEWLLEMFFLRRSKVKTSKLQADLEACSKSRSSLEAAVKAQDTELGTLRTQATRLQGDLNAATQAKSTSDKVLADLKAQSAKLQADLNAATQAKASFDATLKARDAELSDLKLKFGNAQSELNQTKAGHSTLAADVAKFTAGAAASAAAMKALEGDKSDLTAKVNKLQADLNAATQAKSASDKELADLKTQLAKANSYLDIAHQERTKLEGDLQAYRKSSDESTARYNALRAEFEKASTERARPAEAQDAVAAKELPVAVMPVVPVRQPVTTLHKRSADDETEFSSACPQHLSDVKGIGSVYETRLYSAGIGSYWELAHLSDAELRRILQLTPHQQERMDLKSIRQDALRLAKETRSKGRKWTREAPDDLEPVEGIGEVFEKRLYDAGICTYEALANATAELLDEICHPPAQFKPNYAAWIRKAKTLAAKKAKKQSG
jgi:predicted flap endonuclease-1-like 5' DNA nuclease